ncbi:MAG: M15 family metallopeptidase, partial [Pseudohongiella sp.]|nr:M15 family metallopeptidase [Pseudohongiella sp.]
MRNLLIVFLAVLGVACSNNNDRPDLPDGFSYLSALDASIQHDMRYAGRNNFLGRPVTGYDAAECILTTPAAEALTLVQEAVNTI